MYINSLFGLEITDGIQNYFIQNHFILLVINTMNLLLII